MLGAVLRTLLLGIIVGLFIWQARRVPAGSYRRRAFLLAAVAIGIIALLTLLNLLGMHVAVLIIPGSLVATVLLAVGAIFLVLAWRAGEMREQFAQMRQMFEEERKRD